MLPVRHVRKGLARLISGPAIYPLLDKDLWTYRTYGNIVFVDAFTSL